MSGGACRQTQANDYNRQFHFCFLGTTADLKTVMAVDSSQPALR
jgi:hypothetical protein